MGLVLHHHSRIPGQHPIQSTSMSQSITHGQSYPILRQRFKQFCPSQKMSVLFKNHCNLSPNTLLPSAHSSSLIITFVVEMTEEGGISNSPLRKTDKRRSCTHFPQDTWTEIPSASSEGETHGFHQPLVNRDTQTSHHLSPTDGQKDRVSLALPDGHRVPSALSDGWT